MILGGPGGAKLKLFKRGIIILLVGVGHKCQSHDQDFLCAGAFPQGRDYDTNMESAQNMSKRCPRLRNY
jgi:uncharacterized protein YjlB